LVKTGLTGVGISGSGGLTPGIDSRLIKNGTGRGDPTEFNARGK